MREHADQLLERAGGADAADPGDNGDGNVAGSLSDAPGALVMVPASRGKTAVLLTGLGAGPS